MPKYYEYKEGKLVVCYDLGSVQCPRCGWRVLGYFKNCELVKTEPCTRCSKYGDDGQDSREWVQ